MRLVQYVFMFSFLLLLSCGGEEKKADEQKSVEGDVLIEKVKQVHTTTISRFQKSNEILATGRIKKSQHYDLSFPLNGTIDQLLVKKGSWVVKGKQLASIIPVGISNRSQQSSLAVRQLDAKIESLNSQLAAAQKIYKQNIRLRDDDIISGIQLMDSRLKVEGLDEALKSTLLQRDIAFRDQNVLNERKSQHILTAPISGNIIDVAVRVGENVGAGLPVITMQGGEQLDLFELSVPGKDVVKLTKGDGVNIYLDAYPNEVFKGKVDYISPEPMGRSAAYMVEVTIRNTSNPLIAGLFGHVAIITSDVNAGSAIPLNALYWADENDAQVLISENDTAALRNIKVGQILDNQIIVKSGLLDSDQIILNSNGLVNPGDKLLLNSKR